MSKNKQHAIDMLKKMDVNKIYIHTTEVSRSGRVTQLIIFAISKVASDKHDLIDITTYVDELGIGMGIDDRGYLTYSALGFDAHFHLAERLSKIMGFKIEHKSF